jgi:spore photoproduct lyase
MNQDGYSPRGVDSFKPERIILAKGSLSTPERRALVESVCSLYPSAEVVEILGTPHNRINLGTGDPLQLHIRGKRTLVFGEHKSAVRLGSEGGNSCPNYWHFSPYGFCPYKCHYCYLAGTPGIRFSPTVKIFLNLEEILLGIDRAANRLKKPTAFYLGKLQDGLALDPLTGFSHILVPFFAEHPYARMTLLTKSADVMNLLKLKHNRNTILSWTVNPPEICEQFEIGAPPAQKRIEAMKACAQAGYPVRAIVMPVIPIDNWRELYERFLENLLAEAHLDRITLGGICIYPSALDLMERKIGKSNLISEALSTGYRSLDGRSRYPTRLRTELYSHLFKKIRQICSDLTIGLCLEEKAVFEALNLTASIGRCNCVL